jgi:hypothetical protein
MTLTRALPPEAAKTPDRVGAGTESDIPGLPEVLGAFSCKWSRMSTFPSTRADDAVSSQAWDMVDEWGLQSFPASDPPSNW